MTPRSRERCSRTRATSHDHASSSAPCSKRRVIHARPFRARRGACSRDRAAHGASVNGAHAMTLAGDFRVRTSTSTREP